MKVEKLKIKVYNREAIIIDILNKRCDDFVVISYEEREPIRTNMFLLKYGDYDET